MRSITRRPLKATTALFRRDVAANTAEIQSLNFDQPLVELVELLDTFDFAAIADHWHGSLATAFSCRLQSAAFDAPCAPVRQKQVVCFRSPRKRFLVQAKRSARLGRQRQALEITVAN